MFEGFALEGKAREEYETVAHALIDTEDAILRDARVNWMTARTAYDRLEPARQQYEETRTAYRLAQSRYQVGLGSTIELVQARLDSTKGEITLIEARIDY